MSEDKNVLDETLASQEDISEDVVELETELVEDQQVEDEGTLDEAKKVKEDESEEDDTEEEDEDDEKEVEESAPTVPKTKAGIIQATVDMLKNAKKEDASKMFAKMTAVSETSDEDEDDSESKMKAKAKVESVDFEEDLDAMIAEEATLSEAFRGKAGAIFEAVLTSKLAQEVERLETEYASNLEEEVSDVKGELVEKVDSYLNYVVSNWMKENEVAVTEGLRTEVSNEFMTSLQAVFKEHYIEVPEGKVDLVDELSSQVAELEETLNQTTEENIQLHESNQSLTRSDVVREQSSGLAHTEAEKLASLVEDIDFDNKDNFEMKVKVVRESYFTKDLTESVDDVSTLVGNDTAPVAALSSNMDRYTQAISNFNK